MLRTCYLSVSFVLVVRTLDLSYRGIFFQGIFYFEMLFGSLSYFLVCDSLLFGLFYLFVYFVTKCIILFVFIFIFLKILIFLEDFCCSENGKGYVWKVFKFLSLFFVTYFWFYFCFFSLFVSDFILSVQGLLLVLTSFFQFKVCFCFIFYLFLILFVSDFIFSVQGLFLFLTLFSVQVMFLFLIFIACFDFIFYCLL